MTFYEIINIQYSIFEGNSEDVEKMIQWCHSGPPQARVENVEVDHQDYRGEFDSFSIRH